MITRLRKLLYLLCIFGYTYGQHFPSFQRGSSGFGQIGSGRRISSVRLSQPRTIPNSGTSRFLQTGSLGTNDNNNNNFASRFIQTSHPPQGLQLQQQQVQQTVLQPQQTLTLSSQPVVQAQPVQQAQPAQQIWTHIQQPQTPQVAQTSHVTSAVQAPAVGTGSHVISQPSLPAAPSVHAPGMMSPQMGMASPMEMMMDPMAHMMGGPMMGGPMMGPMGMGPMGMGPMGMGMPFMSYDTMEDLFLDPDRPSGMRMAGAGLHPPAAMRGPAATGMSSAPAAPAAPAGAASAASVGLGHLAAPVSAPQPAAPPAAGTPQVDPAVIQSALQTALGRVQQRKATAG